MSPMPSVNSVVPLPYRSQKNEGGAPTATWYRDPAPQPMKANETISSDAQKEMSPSIHSGPK